MPGKTRIFLSPVKPANRAAEGDALLDGRYRIVRLLGEGGMGAVYLASHVGLGRDVAIKFLHAEFISREDIVGRFRREAQAAAAIRHKNIIEVFDVGVSPQGEPFLVMEYLEGESLAGLLKRVGPLSLGAACAVMEPALQALQAAHRKGIVHRDLKPDNIFLAYQEGEPPVVKIIDFGISKFTQGDPDKWRTRTGAVMGTPAYMSPEQARGSAGLDHRTDLYSMGTILFEMLTGALPYAGTNFAEYLSAMLVNEPRAPQSVYADFPIEAEPLVLKALAKNPDQRFQNAAVMLEALTALPSYDAGKERLSLLASTLEVRGFAAGDLGQALSKPGKLTGDKATPSGLRGVSTALTRGGGWRWIVLAGALAVLIGRRSRVVAEANQGACVQSADCVPACAKSASRSRACAQSATCVPARSAAHSPERASTCPACCQRAGGQRHQAIGCEREEAQEEGPPWDCRAAGSVCRSRGTSSHLSHGRPERRQACRQEAAQGQPRHRDVRGV